MLMKIEEKKTVKNIIFKNFLFPYLSILLFYFRLLAISILFYTIIYNAYFV